MKVTLAITLFLVIKVKASFFDEFSGAMSSVENAFGKLLNDVVTDVKITVHCTILAMEQVLAINGVIPEPLANKECDTDEKNDKLEIVSNRNNPKFYSKKNIADEIHSSISKVNKTLSNILDNNGHERLEEVKRVLKNESNRLTEVSLLLRHELEKISHRINKEFPKINKGSDKSTLESVKNDMEILYEVEKNNKNVSEEIGQVLNEALNVLHINTLDEVKTDKDKINAIVKELEHETNNGSVSKLTVNNELSQWKDKEFATFSSGLEQKSEGTSESFVSSDVLSANTKTENDGNNSPKDSGDYSPFSELNADDSVHAIEQAMNIIKNSAHSQTLLDNFFANEQGADLFDSSNSFNLNK